ncbi:MAG: YceK/YidQ family lipoprotein [Candidatus Omnitrophica bacterium]|nr:YceK/YidQ family lipoprotein [Candidatus Omnitrophota bacterium]
MRPKKTLLLDRKTIKKLVSLILIAHLLTGCSSIHSHRTDVSPRVYPGVKEDMRAMKGFACDADEWGGLGRSFAIWGTCDILFSFVGDTLLLPYDMYKVHKEKDEKRDASCEFRPA